MDFLGFIFKSLGDFFKWLAGLIPIWGWVLLGSLTVLGIGAWGFKVYVDRTVSGYEKKIADEELAKDNAIVDRNAALGEARTRQQQRDALMNDLRTAQLEAKNIGDADAKLRGELTTTKRNLNAKIAQERARLGDPAQFQEQLNSINGDLKCAVDNINKPGSCVNQ